MTQRQQTPANIDQAPTENLIMQHHKIRTLVLIACTTALLMGTAPLRADCTEVGYIASFEVKPGREMAFEEAIVKLATKVLEDEAGTLFYAPYHAEGQSYYMLERYKDLAAREQHAQSDEIKALFPALLANLAAPIEVKEISAVCNSEHAMAAPKPEASEG